MKKILLSTKLVFAIILVSNLVYSQTDSIPSMRKEDRIRIAEVFRIADKYCKNLWTGWGKTPFPVLLVYDDYEFLVNLPDPGKDFNFVGYDSLLKSDVFYRKRVFDVHLLATFPAINGISTVVVGTPENTGKNSALWIVTLLHEHFHQFQYEQPDYYQSVNSLDLSGNDKTGMWMLNYPFPYENRIVDSVYTLMTKKLVSIFDDNKFTNENLNEYLTLRDNFVNLLNGKDSKYFSFQLWQEGIARYTEIQIARLLSENKDEYIPQMKTLSDFKDYNSIYNQSYSNSRNLLNGLKLNESKRNCFYPLGAFEGLLLDKFSKPWKLEYFKKKFYLEKYFE